MHTNFDQIIDRTNTGSIKWAFPHLFLTPKQAAANPLPLWVADMDFHTPKVIKDALITATQNEVLGYCLPTASYFEAVCAWQQKRFDWQPKENWIVQTPGVVTALNIAIQAFTKAGDAVLIQPPVYVHFQQDVLNNERQIVTAPLDLNEDGSYAFDAAKFEAAITKNTKLFILSNPHNPTGNVWSEQDLQAMGEICLRHNILIISDEIHQDLIFNQQKRHIPFAKLSAELAQNVLVCTAPSKTFNIAGLQVSNIFIPNAKLKAEFTSAATKNGIHFVNYLGMVACEAAYRYGEDWLFELLSYIDANYNFLHTELKTHLPQIKVTPTDALYLAWLDFRSLNMNAADLMDFLTIKAGVWFDDGQKFGREGCGFMRINLGCPRSTLIAAINRLKAAINDL